MTSITTTDEDFDALHNFNNLSEKSKHYIEFICTKISDGHESRLTYWDMKRGLHWLGVDWEGSMILDTLLAGYLHRVDLSAFASYKDSDYDLQDLIEKAKTRGWKVEALKIISGNWLKGRNKEAQEALLKPGRQLFEIYQEKTNERRKETEGAAEERRATENRKAAEKRRKAVERAAEEAAEERRATESRKAAENRKAAEKKEYDKWESDYKTAFLNKAAMTRFPFPTLPRCTAESCLQSVCQHNVERFLRSSGKFSLKLLKVLRNQWHPDRFASCSPEFKVEFQQLATSLFNVVQSMYEHLKTKETEIRG